MQHMLGLLEICGGPVFKATLLRLSRPFIERVMYLRIRLQPFQGLAATAYVVMFQHRVKDVALHQPQVQCLTEQDNAGLQGADI